MDCSDSVRQLGPSRIVNFFCAEEAVPADESFYLGQVIAAGVIAGCAALLVAKPVFELTMHKLLNAFAAKEDKSYFQTALRVVLLQKIISTQSVRNAGVRLAVEHGLKGIIEEIPVDRLDPQLLFLALDAKQYEILEVLLKRVLDKNPVIQSGGNSVPLLLHALTSKDEKALDILLNHVEDLECEMVFDDGKRLTPLGYALSSGQRKAAIKLLNKGALTTAQIIQSTASIPLIRLVVTNRDFELLRLFLSKGAKPKEFCDEQGCTLLHWGVKEPGILNLLMQAGVDKNKQNKKGYAPIHLAAMGTREPIRLTAIGGGGFVSGMEMSNPNSREPCFSSLKVLAESGAWLSTTSVKGKTPLFLALKSGLYESSRYLLGKGAPLMVFRDLQSNVKTRREVIALLDQLKGEAVPDFNEITLVDVADDLAQAVREKIEAAEEEVERRKMMAKELEERLGDVPKEFEDPISYNVLTDPVRDPTTADKQVIDRESLLSIAAEKSKSPFSSLELLKETVEGLETDQELLKRINTWLDASV